MSPDKYEYVSMELGTNKYFYKTKRDPDREINERVAPMLEV